MLNGVRGRQIAVLCLTVALLIAGTALIWNDSAEGRQQNLTVACGDDLAGMIFSVLLEESGTQKIDLGLDYVSLGDCCGSNAQFALSTGDVDVALLCPDAATELLASGTYTACGAVVYDGDVLVTRPDSPTQPAVIGYMNRREEQRMLLEKIYDPETVRLQPMFPSGLAYALENRSVDAIVLDASAALRLQYPVQPLSSGAVTTIMIVKTTLLDDERLPELVQRYQNYTDTLSDDAVLGQLLCRYLETDRQEEVINLWKTMNVRFGFLTTGTS